MAEQWKPIIGWEGRYDISSNGMVRSWYYGKKKLDEARLLKTKVDQYGYVVVSLHHADKKKTYTIHRLVALSFVPNPFGLSQVNHKNGNKMDNRAENLEWCSPSYNIQHAFDNGLISKQKCSLAQIKRYQDDKQREISRERAKAMWKDEPLASKMRSCHNTPEYRKKMSDNRKKQSPPTKGFKRIHNGVKERAVPISDLPKLLEEGWTLGRLPKTIRKKGS